MKKTLLDVYTPMKGTVKFVLTSASDYGKRIYIEYNNCILMFAHLSEIIVREGQIVEAGQRIGLMGDTGYSEGVHLHISAFNKRARKLTAQWTVDPTFILKLAPCAVTNTQVSNGYGSIFCNPKLKKHEGIDFGTRPITNWEKINIDPLYVDYRLKADYPKEYK